MVKGKGNKKNKKAANTAGKNVPTKNEDSETFEDNGELDPEDLEYFQDSHRSFAFLQEVAAE